MYRYTQMVSPVPGSAATTDRRSPAVKYKTPSTISGVFSFLISSPLPKLSPFHVQTTLRFLTFAALIWSNGEYRVLPPSPPIRRHSPLAGAPFCPAAPPTHSIETATTAAGQNRNSFRDICVSLRSTSFEDEFD